jgi:hypothetical protein
MRNRLVTSLLAGALGLMVWACTVQATPPYPSVSSFCEAKAKAICQVSDLCAVDPNACQNNQATQCDADAKSALASGTRKYNTDNAPTCIDALKAAFGSSASVVKDAAWRALLDTCGRVFVGNANKNDPCTSDYDCANDLVCASAQPGSTTTSLVCAAVVLRIAGDLCGLPGYECPADTYCATPPQGPPAQCIPAAQAGQACTAAIPCVSTQTCSNGLCAPRAPNGVACSSSSDCGVDSPFCDPYAGSICTIGLTFATAAADCKGFLLGAAVSTPDAGSE